MKTFLRWLLIIPALLVGAPIVAFGAYDLISFQSRTDQIQALIDNAPPEDRVPPPFVSRLVRASERYGVSNQLARILITRLDVIPPQSHSMTRLFTEVMWLQLIQLHLSEQQQMALYCSQVYVGDYGHGLTAASTGMFHKPLSALSPTEAATIVAIPFAPKLFAQHPEVLIHRRDELLSRASTAQY
jgi:hypothetical protein